MSNRDEVYKFTKQQIKADERHSKKLKSIVKTVSAAYITWWVLFQSKNQDYTHADDSKVPDTELTNELHSYATENNLNRSQPANNAELLSYAAILFSSVLAYKTIDYVTEQLTKDKHFTAEFGSKLYGLSNNELSNAIIDVAFDGVKWSDNIWLNQVKLKNDMHSIMMQSLYKKENPLSSTRTIRDKYDTYRYQSERILRTEGARISGEQQKSDIIAANVTKMEWVASAGSCKICSDLDGDIFKADSLNNSKYTIPKHPNCRCAVVGVD